MKLYPWIACILAFSLAPAFASTPRIGVVGAANQSLTATASGEPARRLHLGQNLFFNELITTDHKGSAQLMFIDKSTLTVGSNAAVKIDAFVYNPNASKGELVMEGTKGAFRFIGGALSKQHPVMFKTPVATIGIRGGIALIEIDAKTGATQAIFAYGHAMTVRNLSGVVQEVTTPGYSVSVASARSIPSAPTKIEPKALQKKLDQFESKYGQTGEAQVIPTNASVTSETSNTGNSGNNSENNPGNSGHNPGNNSGNNSGHNSGNAGNNSAVSNTANTITNNSQTSSVNSALSEPITYLNPNGTAASATQGQIRSSSTIAGSTRCTGCAYADWGVWAANTGGAGTAVDLTQITRYVSGEITQNLGNLNMNGVANYSGIATGTRTNSLTNQKAVENGSFTAKVHLGQREVRDFSMSIGGRSFGFNNEHYAIPATGMATFGDLPVSGGNILTGTTTGTINGALFGPQAQNIGGNFTTTTNNLLAGDEQRTGVFVGTR